tara:strand:+ start:644 stop:928 length:285 start_codon:yes stop_codon:yes gene_type:complete
MVKALFKLIKQIAVKLFKENDTQFLTIAKSMATIIAQETPTKVDDRLLRIINNNAKNMSNVEKLKLAQKLTSENTFIPDLIVSYINKKFKIKKK